MQRKIVALSVLVLALSVLPAGASTFVFMDEGQLVADSTAVVKGTVVSVDSFWNASHTAIFTEAVFEVESSIVGEAPRFVTVRVAGGTVGDYTIEALGFPTFQAGERSLLFLGAQEGETFRVTGYQLGHYHILTNRLGVEVAVPTLDQGAHLVSATGRSVEAPKARPLATFEASLQAQGRKLQMTDDVR
jgi:hypothetical protein